MKFFLFSLLILVVCACNPIYLRNHFTTYKETPFKNADPIKLQGIYFTKSYPRIGPCGGMVMFFLYSDGSVISSNTIERSDVPESDFWKEPDRYVETMRLKGIPKRPGHFFIRGNQITLEMYNAISSTSFYTIQRYTGTVDDNSTITFTEKIDFSGCPGYKKGATISLQNMKYGFQKTTSRPDSSMFIKTRKWYKRNVWYSN